MPSGKKMVKRPGKEMAKASDDIGTSPPFVLTVASHLFVLRVRGLGGGCSPSAYGEARE
jgi:hypothetical protein